ncbi:MAG: hypothetical protein GY896_18675 [Gammaproteobacteria bacterium]|nr:hypothetical protein [Gammaproteobacteria bacterium]
MNLVWVILVTATSVSLGTGLCFYLLYQASEVDSTEWILQHIVCPIIRIIVLLIVVSQVYPAIDAHSTSVDFWRTLSQQGQFNHLLNILFFAGLLLSFIPVASHPVFALPLQSIITIALVFHWQYKESMDSILLLPSIATLLKILAYMLLAYFVTRETSIYLSRRIDRKLTISGSIHLVSDAIYLILQIPVMLIYCSFLKLQLS